MGVPAFFRWLSKKYPSIVVHCTEEKPKIINGVKIPVDASQPNPNDFEFDNLYLDMNGIIHPCCHPEDKPAPKNEDEMMVLIFEYIDRLFSIVRPRRLLYMAIDGVAPRAKMNQQRSRRFRASKETAEKIVETSRIREELSKRGAYLPPEKLKEEHFDSNCITPGTPFMDRLAKCLHYYIHDRLNTDSGWKNIKVILSDANVPGEGEHKIMDFIRRQRANPDHDPNTRHCLCGADADLIMLGLATHEPNFTIIREEFKPNQPRPCEICAQVGHEMKDCQGLPKEKAGEFDELKKPMAPEQEFIFLRLNVLREYLEKELTMHNLPFAFDLERALDDWVFMCFFVGNDFLPHLPSLEIRENAIDRLIGLYKKAVFRTGGYLTDSGLVNPQRVQLIMSELGEVEDEIFKRRQENELSFRRRAKDRKKRMKLMNSKPAWVPAGQFAPNRIQNRPAAITNPRLEAYHMRTQGKDLASLDPAKALKSMLTGDQTGDNKGQKRKHDSDSEEEPVDDVRLWEDGWKDRYYVHKFDVAEDNFKFRYQVAAAYTYGLCWVLRYYYQGCASWKWFFPYHYAPFASDFMSVGDVSNEFEKGTQPFKPLEQLMGVFPAASKQHLPDPWGYLMDDPESPIIDFYPDDFKIDLNGKKFAWQGVALLPFVDEKRLLTSLKEVYPHLTRAEERRNVRGDDRLYIGKNHTGYSFLLGLYEGDRNFSKEINLVPKFFGGIGGRILLSEQVVEPNQTLKSIIPGQPDLHRNQALCVRFRDPAYDDDFIFPAKRLPGAVSPPQVLKPEDLDQNASRNWRPQIGMAPATQRAYLDTSGHRSLGHHVRTSGFGQYSSMPPPPQLSVQYPMRNQSYGGQGYSGRGGNSGRSSGNRDSWSSRSYGEMSRSSSGSGSGSSYQSRSYSQQQGSSYGNSSGNSSGRSYGSSSSDGGCWVRGSDEEDLLQRQRTGRDDSRGQQRYQGQQSHGYGGHQSYGGQQQQSQSQQQPYYAPQPSTQRRGWY